MSEFYFEMVHEAYIDEFVKNHKGCNVRLKVNGFYKIAVPIVKDGE